MAVIDLADQWASLPDASLVEEAQAGRIDAFTALYERHHRGILRHCRARLGNDHDAADAAQETFLRAWRALGTFGGERRLAPWLRTIATNVCLDVLRTRGRAVPVATFDATAAEVHDARPDTDAVKLALARLSDRHREILHLREYQGWSYERIAEQQQLDLNAVKSLLWRARQSLRREFLLVSAQGRLAALGGLLLARPAARLRALFSEASTAVAQAGVAGGTAATAAVMTATVALPVFVPPAATPPPPVPVVVAAEATSTAVVVPASTFVAPVDPNPALQAAASAPPDTVAASTEPEPDVAPVGAATPGPASEAVPEPVKEERKAEQAETKADREAERSAAADERAEAKEERKAVREERTKETGRPEHAGGPAGEPPGQAKKDDVELVVEAPGRSDDAPGQQREVPDRGRGRDGGS